MGGLAPWRFIFWLMAAIDGHAKNFSLFIEPGSAYRMTPLYDVISAYPLIAQGSMAAEKAKSLMKDVAEQTRPVIQSVEARLPADFPPRVSEPILNGLARQSEVLSAQL